MLNINPTHVLFIALLVWALMIILNKLYVKPISKIIDEREAKIERETAQIESMSNEIEEKTLEVENVLKDARKQSSKIKEELIKKGETIREKIVADAREDSRDHFNKKMDELDLEIKDAETKLEQEISHYSDKLKEIFIG